MLAYSKGPDEPLLETTIGRQLAASAARNPDGVAVVSRHQDRRLTWAELDAIVTAWARGLVGLGLEPGDRVGVWASNCWEWVALQLATARAGIVLVNVNPAYRAHELAYVIRKSRMRALFLRESDARSNYRAILEAAGVMPEHVFYLAEGATYFTREADFEEPTDPHVPVNIQYTSGTTGSPKGVLLTHHNLLNNALLVGNRMRMSQADVLCLPVPLYHCFGCVMGSLATAVFGSTLVLPSPQFDAGAVLEAIHDERATIIYGVPTMFIAELGHPDFARYDLTSLRTGIMAGAPCPIEVMRRVVDDMHCREMTIAYGQTETSPVSTMSFASDPLDLRVTTVGSVLPCTEVKIADPATGETLQAGQQGELCSRGYLVMPGYDGEPEATARTIDADGWLHSGDLAVMREDGYFRITGRAKDMIIRGGENIYPREIEEFLYTHPAIADVQAFGLPDSRLGEIVAVWVRLCPGATMTEDELRGYCRDRIAHFKIPSIIRFVDQFPMTVTGKIQKFRMRESEVERLGLDAAARVETA